MDKKIGLIGVGNMGGAIIEGLIQSNTLQGNQIYAYDLHLNDLRDRAKDLGFHLVSGNLEILEKTDIIFLAIKPQVIQDVLEEIKDYAKPHHIFITMSPGVSIEYTQSFFRFNTKIIRIMPNTPALIGEGMTAFTCSSSVNGEEKRLVQGLLNSFGLVEEIEEKLLDAVTAISGSSPAYVDIFIESLADGGVLLGLPRDKAYKFAAQAVVGAAKMVLKTGKHPAELRIGFALSRNNNCRGTSVGKTWIWNAIIEAMIAVDKKSKEMSKNR